MDLRFKELERSLRATQQDVIRLQEWRDGVADKAMDEMSTLSEDVRDVKGWVDEQRENARTRVSWKVAWLMVAGAVGAAILGAIATALIGGWVSPKG